MPRKRASKPAKPTEPATVAPATLADRVQARIRELTHPDDGSDGLTLSAAVAQVNREVRREAAEQRRAATALPQEPTE